MASLQEFGEVAQKLKTGKRGTIEVLHKFIFETVGDRGNRQRLRTFTGFEYDKNDVRYVAKCEYIAQNLTDADLTSISILLGLEYNVGDLSLHIFNNLRKHNLLRDAEKEEEDDDDDGDDDELNEASQSQPPKIAVQDDASSVVSVTQRVDACSVSGQHYQRGSGRFNQQPRFALNFRDVEESVRTFDGSGDVEEWVQDFESTAMLMGWDELQMLVFAKKSLKGLAKMFVAGERGLTTWDKLREALLDEFSQKINSAQIHKMMSERRMKANEEVQEYFYKMKEIAAKGNVEEKAIIQYVIEGIRDAHVNKAILYGANDMREFKEKLHNYAMFNKNQKTSNDNVTFTKKQNEEQRVDKKPLAAAKQDGKLGCFKCGEKGHLAGNCTKGTKCFKCNKFGHIARECRNKAKEEKTNEEKTNNVQIVAPEEKNSTGKENPMCKEVRMANRKYTALVDTGSAFHIISSTIYEELGGPRMNESNVVMKGFGHTANKLRPMGKIDMDVGIDEDEFNLEFQVVPKACMGIDVIIGRPLCDRAEIHINPDGIRVKKLEEVAMMQVNIEDEDERIEVDIGEMANKESKQIIEMIVNEYVPNKKKNTNVNMKIILLDETPIACGPRRLPITEKRVVDEQIEQWLKDGVIENSESEFSSPIVLVSKKDGSKRLCVDYRRINKVIARDRFPLPLIEDQLDRLKDAKWYSTIDLKNGFFHVPVDGDSRKYTSFVTHNGQYQFCKVPFGLSNSPAVFQRHINAIFREMTFRGIALPYVDDIIIPAKSEEEAIKNLKEVLGQCQDYGLCINWKKCQFLKREIEFLGHVIKEQTISPSLTKKEVMLNYPVPKTLKQLESFLGLAGYFRKFIADFACIAKPLSDLRKKDVKFVMNSEHIHSFNTLKHKLSESPVLKIFNEEHATELHTDASADGYGAVLMQKLPEDGKMHPVYYMSRKTSDAERKYSSYELEILAVVEAVKKFRVYLLGINFKVVTDCDAFVKTMAKKDLVTRVARWLMLLQEYQYTVEHRSGTRMRHVDALSRQAVMMIGNEGILTKIIRAQSTDEVLQPIFKVLQHEGSYKGFYLKSNALYKLENDCELLVIPGTMEWEIIKRAHEKGHFSVAKTKGLIINDYYIPKLEEKIQKFVTNCVECIMMNRKRGKQEGELHPISKQEIPLHTYHVDHLGPLESTSKQYKHIFVVIDGFTKFCWLYPTKSTTSKEVIARLQLQSTTFGNPRIIISDRGTAFTSEEFRKYCEEEGIGHHLVTTGLPRANGQVERLNSVIIAVLSKLSVEEPAKWYQHVAKVQQIINSTYHRSTGLTPFEVLVGGKMHCREDIKIKQAVEEEIMVQYDKERKQLRAHAKQQIAKVQDENRRSYNLRRRPAAKYKVGDLVAVRRTQLGGGLKLRAKYLGPYAVAAAKPKNTYDVIKKGSGEGPNRTTTCAEYMKAWTGDFGAKIPAGWPNCGNGGNPA